MKKLLISKLEGCPVNIFDKRYAQIRKENFKNKQGIYALYDKKNNLYYVGHASNLSGRLKQHLKHNRHAKQWEHFSVYFTSTKEDASALEAVILSVCPPKGNKKTAKVSKVVKDAEMKRRIEKQMKKIDEERRQFRKPGISAKNKKHRAKLQDTNVRKSASQDGAQKRKLQLKDLFSNGVLSGRKPLKADYKTKTFHAVLLPPGEIEYQGIKYSTPSPAAQAAKNSQSENGWTVWKIQNRSDKWVTLKEFIKAVGFKAKPKPVVIDHGKFLKEKEVKNNKSSQLHLFSVNTLALQVKYKNKIYSAKLLSCGKKVQYEGKTYSSPSGAAKVITGFSVNGWAFWSAQTSSGNWVKLSSLRALDKAS